jgi:ABC transporter transmembrane region.
LDNASQANSSINDGSIGAVSNSENEIIIESHYEYLGWMPSTQTCIYIYVGFIIGIIVLTLSSTFSFFSLCMKSSMSLHNKMFDTIIHATMNFFVNNPSGKEM